VQSDGDKSRILGAMASSTTFPLVKHNMFLSWSGSRSKWIADAFFEWLPLTIQSSKPWMSAQSIEKGTRSLQEIAKALDGIKVGITFLTPENLTEPWILYEAGALTKNVDDKTRLYTYLLGGLEPQDIRPPLGILQHTRPTKGETLTLLKSINSAMDSTLSEKQVETVFEEFWNKLAKKIKTLPKSEAAAPSKRRVEDMVAEILTDVRAIRNSVPTMLTYPSLSGFGGVAHVGNSNLLAPYVNASSFYGDSALFNSGELPAANEPVRPVHPGINVIRRNPLGGTLAKGERETEDDDNADDHTKG